MICYKYHCRLICRLRLVTYVLYARSLMCWCVHQVVPPHFHREQVTNRPRPTYHGDPKMPRSDLSEIRVMPNEHYALASRCSFAANLASFLASFCAFFSSLLTFGHCASGPARTWPGWTRLKIISAKNMGMESKMYVKTSWFPIVVLSLLVLSPANSMMRKMIRNYKAKSVKTHLLKYL